MAYSVPAWSDKGWVTAAVQELLEPGETISAICNFNAWPDGMYATALTNRYLRFVSFRLPLAKALFGNDVNWPDRPCPVKSHHVYALSQISAVGEKRSGQRSTMYITGPWGTFEAWTLFPEGVELIAALRARASTDAAQPFGVAEEIAKLAELNAAGALTDDEFQRAKAAFIGAPVERQKDTLEVLRQLHSLQRSGVLTESEFRQKKWDILSRSEL